MRKVEYTRGLADGSSLSITIHDEGDELVLVLTDEYDKVRAFRGDDIAALHDAIHECAQASDGLKAMTETMMRWGATDEEDESVDALTDGAERQEAGDEAESELDVMDYAILLDLAEPGQSLLSIGEDPAYVWANSGAPSTFTSESLQNLCDHRLVVFTSTFPISAPNCKRRWRITGAGRTVLAAQGEG